MNEMTKSEAIQLFEDDWQADRHNRDLSLEDLRFCNGEHWTDAERAAREAAGRPCLTINRMPQFVNQVAGDIRQAQPGIEVFPVDSEGDVELARIYEGLIRQVEYQSNAGSAYAYAAQSAVRCGIGHLRIETDFTQDSVFEQEIKIKRILDPLSVVWDGAANEIDRCDAKHCWVTSLISKAEFKKRFPDADASDFDLPDGVPNDRWATEEQTRIAEYWYLEDTKREYVMLNDGRTFDVTDWSDRDRFELQLSGEVMDMREGEGFKVKRRVLNGTGWIEDAQDWAGKYIPVIPIIGDEISYDGLVMRNGLIRWAKDAQKLYNVWRSAGAEAIGQAPKSPWLVTPDMIAGLESFWANANRTNAPYLPYHPDTKAPGAEPKRQAPPAPPAAMWQEAAIAADDMKATTGIFDAGLGAQGNETSGRAIMARQREGDVGTYLFSDNFQTALHRVGRVLVDLVPRIYDTQRTVRILGREGDEAFVPINTQVQSHAGETLMVNDLSHGRFDVRVKVGASYTTARVEAREQMAQAMQANPQLWQVIGDLFFKNSDYPGAEEIAERLRRAVPPQLLEDESEQPPDPMAQAMGRLELASKQADVENTQADTEKKQAEAQKTAFEARRTLIEPIGV